MKYISDCLELRLDNLVYDKHGEVHRFGWMDFRNFIHPQMGGNYGFSAIPLSDELLQKLALSHEIYHDGVIIYKFNVFNVYKQGNTIWVAEGLNHGRMYEHIQSIHQLQNLFYALTGKEININSIH